MNKKSNKHNILTKNIIFTILPTALFPIIDNIIYFNTFSKIVFFIISAMFICFLVICISLKEERETEELQQKIIDYEKFCIAQKILNCLSETERTKRNFLKKDLSSINLTTDILLYSPHLYIETVCENIKTLISNITDITLSSFSVSFIYQYPNCSDSNWQWITRKEGTLNQSLHDFVTNNKFHSYFHFLISNNLSSHFENDKEKLVKKGNYWISEGDMRFSQFGSIASYKISFNRNDQALCIGYLTVSTYGRKFVEEEQNEQKIKEFNILLSDIIIPPFRHLLESELGFMYERHIRRNNLSTL